MAIFGVIDTGTGQDTFYEGMVKDAANWAILEAALSAATTTILVGGGAGTVPVMTTCTGTGAPVKATSPTLVTPTLGTPAGGTLTNCTGLPAAGVTGTAAVVANTIKGDGTSGRVLRAFALRFYPGATPGTNINIVNQSPTYAAFNSPTMTNATNLAAEGTSGSFSLNAAGTIITMDITPAFIGILSSDIIAQNVNSAGTVPHYIACDVASSNLTLYITAEGSCTPLDWRTVLDASDNFYARFCVVTDS